MRQKIYYIISVIITFFIGIGGTLTVLHFFPLTNEVIEKTVSNVNITEENTLKPAIEKIYDAVVVIESYSGSRQTSSGTGFVYKKDKENGYIITNHHVIEGANSIKVINSSGQTVDAKLLGSDAFADIAVLSIDPNTVLKVSEIGDSTKLELGDTLFTVGTPVGKEYMGTVTRGILSGKDRTVTVSNSQGGFMMEVLQTDAAINPGNSGGPLVNINGEVVGVNSMKLVQEQIEGMGFAIPIEFVMGIIDRLEKGENIERPMIGATLSDLSNPYSLYLNGIILDEEIENGVVVISTEKDYPAQIAGLKKGDVILEINGTKIESMAHFRFTLYKYSVGDKIKITYYRDKKIKEIELTLSKSIEDSEK